jgi:hypothetical protein
MEFFFHFLFFPLSRSDSLSSLILRTGMHLTNASHKNKIDIHIQASHKIDISYMNTSHNHKKITKIHLNPSILYSQETITIFTITGIMHLTIF